MEVLSIAVLESAGKQQVAGEQVTLHVGVMPSGSFIELSRISITGRSRKVVGTVRSERLLTVGRSWVPVRRNYTRRLFVSMRITVRDGMFR